MTAILFFSFLPFIEEPVSDAVVVLLVKLCASSLVAAVDSDHTQPDHHLLLHCVTLSHQVMAASAKVSESVLCLLKSKSMFASMAITMHMYNNDAGHSASLSLSSPPSSNVV